MRQVQSRRTASLLLTRNGMPALPDHRFHVFGVDFSGAKDAGKHIWIAKGTVDSSSRQPSLLHAEDCRRVDSLLGCPADLEPCLAALRDLIIRQSDAVFGLDFPFGLPGVLLNHERWEEFVCA